MKICFIGSCGHVVPAYTEMKACPEAEFVGIAPADEHESPESLKLEGNGISVFRSYEEMIDKTCPDIAVISPVFGLTGGIIKYCAERGIDVFAEKPVAASIEELEEVEKAVKENGIHFSAMHFLRFTPSFYHAQKMVESGAIGEVRLLTAQKSYKYGTRPEWYSDRRLYVGTIPWVGIHAIDWIYFFAKKNFKSVKAVHSGNPEMTALCQFEMEDDVFASASIDYLRPQGASTHGDDRIRVAGTSGVIEVFEDRYVVINKEGTAEYSPRTAPHLAYDFLFGREEISQDEIFMLTRTAILARESADTNKVIQLG